MCLAAATRWFRVSRKTSTSGCCTPPLCCAELCCDGGKGSFFCTPVRRQPQQRPGPGRRSEEAGWHSMHIAHASAVCSAMTRSHERMRAGMLACWHAGTDGTMARCLLSLSGLCAGLYQTRPLPSMQAAGSSCRWRGGWTIAYLGVRTEERATLRSETGAGGYEPSGWMGGRLRKCF